ncbi:MAG: hypothetical protein A2651_00420 [Candidatus Yanofskybacteria bacterium RIFCSPHIGHO2_01_FULL_42_12]|nr:MAG: hypothetical protein A2651_00420 [Candidatus Yanofskybacteria bacterium RIFCSPHIGHO2_01_FULL_42_12]
MAKYIFHPFLLSVSFIVFLFAHNISELGNHIAFDVVLVPIFVALLFAATAFFVLKMLIPDCHKAGIISSLVVVFFLYYGIFYDIFHGVKMADLLVGRHKFLFPVWFVMILSGGFFVLKTKKYLLPFTKILNLSSVVLVLIPLISIVIYGIGGVGGIKTDILQTIDKGNSATANLPDIYYIIPDRYAGNGILKNFFGYDNKEFSDFLEEKGFIISDESRSNYSQTLLSLPSVLNMEYLGDGMLLESQVDTRFLLDMIRKNKVVGFLKQRGYKIVSFRVGWPISNVDAEIGRPPVGEFSYKLLDSTLIRLVSNRRNIFRDYLNYRMRTVIDLAFKRLGEMPELNLGGPKFIYAHLPVPHWPYLFGPNGEKVAAKFSDTEEMDLVKEKEYYLGQLQYTNRKIMETVELIISNSEIPPVIIIQSDHGFNPESVDPLTMVSNFSAFYLPGKSKNILSKSVSNVNTFRFIFDQYFGTELGLLPNKIYWSSFQEPYKFKEIQPHNL